MSKKSQGVQPETQSTANLSPEIIESLTEKLTELIQTLSLKREEEPPDRPSPAFPFQIKEPDQIRCYRVPGHIVREERETMREHKATDLLDLLQKVHEHFFVTSFLLRHFNDDEEVTGFCLQRIGEQLDYPIRMLNRVCSLLGDFHPLSSAPETSDA